MLVSSLLLYLLARTGNNSVHTSRPPLSSRISENNRSENKNVNTRLRSNLNSTYQHYYMSANSRSPLCNRNIHFESWRWTILQNRKESSRPTSTTMALNPPICSRRNRIWGLKLPLFILILVAVVSTSYVVLVQKWEVSLQVTENKQAHLVFKNASKDDDAKVNIKHNDTSFILKNLSSNISNVGRETSAVKTANKTTHNVSFMADKTRAIQEHRQNFIQTVCQRNFNIQPVDFDSKTSVDNTFKWFLDLTFVNDDYKFTLSMVLKVGSSNWRRFMQDLHRISSKEFRNKWPPLKYLGSRKNGDIRLNLKKYTKVLFVRHPLVRLLSAFQDKFVRLPTRHYIDYAVLIIKKVRHKSPANINKPDMTFTEFLTFLVSIDPNGYDGHWSRIFEKYKPCHVQYDFIGKLETLLPDVDYLTEKLGVKGRVGYRYPEPYSGSSNTSMLIDYYSKVPPKLIQQICKIYRNDFIVFDYQAPEDVLNVEEYFKSIR